MTNDEFRAWLQGYFELTAEEVVLDLAQLQVIVNHLNLAEAVEGKLDTDNTCLRDDIDAFRKGDDNSERACAEFTQELRARALATR